MSPADTPDRDEDLADLLTELETTLTELRGELQAGGRDATGRSDNRESAKQPDRRAATDRQRARDRRRDRSALPRPPSVSELFRFTEQYTLPTLISTLEATIRALELLRGTLRLVDGRSAFDDGDRRRRSSAARLGDGVAGVGREAVSGVERTLAELETALSESDIPDERAGDDLLGEARALSAEITDRLNAAQEESQRRSGSQRDQPDREGDSASDRDSDAVTIEVTDGDGAGRHPDTDDEADHETDAGDGAERHPAVDIDAELESIRHEVRGTDGSGDSDGKDNGTSGGSDATDGDDRGSGGSDATDAAGDEPEDTDDPSA